MAQVAWPGVQPSSAGEGETSTAQEPQPEPEETLKGTPTATPMEVTDEGYGTVDTDYIADITAAQGTWDPWPTTAQDTPMPTQDAPTSPHDDLAPAQDD